MIERLGPVLVANRGEIAVRVMRTCRRLGLRTVAVYSDADAHARHVAAADSALRIGPPSPSESYLHQDRILDAAHRSGAHAIHPGYGFLSENPDFAQAVGDAGLVWIGPPPAAMHALGDKSRAKALAEQNGVPVLAGYHGEDQSFETLRAEAERIGVPLLIKASAGGGGRGMRAVDSLEEFEAALEGARREALASFGNNQVLLERYVCRPRHVEVQVIGDAHGNLIHLGERECSIQRRHQKLIEESPSPAVDPDLRERMGEAALRLARAAGYTSAGTVEFLLEPDGSFSFLEVNARLQVEHPVTEALTGLDLVELQLRVAAGEALPLTQSDVRFEGHAIEVRIIAEDPLAGFLPSVGTIDTCAFPSGVRVDTWIGAGTTVTPYYDSLLAKMIAHAPSRPEAARKLATALRDTRIEGVRTNLDLLLAVLETPAFIGGDLHTDFLAEHHVVEEIAEVPLEVLAAASAPDSFQPPAADPWAAPNGWRLGRLDQPAAWARSGVVHRVRVSADLGGPGLSVCSESREVGVQLVRDAAASDPWSLLVDGRGATVWDRGDFRVVSWRDRSYRLVRAGPVTVEATATAAARSGGVGQLSAPMPGRVVRVAVAEGQHVEANQPLVVLEAMKMEHVVEAPHAGVVADVRAREGDQVAAGAPLLTLAP